MQPGARRRAERGRGGRRGDDGGQMLVLAGAVLVLAFLIAAFAVTELSAQEAELEAGPEGRLAETFHETRDEFAAAMKALTIPSTSNATLLEQFQAQRLEFEERGRAHGLFAVVDLGRFNSTVAHRTEKLNFTDGGAGAACGTAKHTMRSYDRSRDYTGMLWDCADDGILWGDAAQNIRGLVVHLALANEAARVEETFVLSLN